MQLSDDEVIDIARNLWTRHRNELAGHDRIRRYLRGEAGRPSVPEGANSELKELARLSIKNVLVLVRDAFAQSLSVVGFGSPSSDDNAEAWQLWQEQKMDARQGEVHRAAVSYGTAYAIVTRRDGIRLRSPRQLFAVYADPHTDDWPGYALETWIDWSDKLPRRRGRLYDNQLIYPLDLGTVPTIENGEASGVARGVTGDPVTIPPLNAQVDGDPEQHGWPAPPVIRFVTSRDTEDFPVGEIAPLIEAQKALNAVNFDRLVVSRFGAFPQKYAIGWAPADNAELARASAARLMAFEDDNVHVGDFTQASVEPYNSILVEMLTHIALTAQVPVPSVTGSLTNVAAETVAMAEAPHQRKLAGQRESLGESWEQTIRTYAAMNDVDVPDDAECKWRETEARSFAQVVDGITKLAGAGVPIETLLPDVPGWTQQRVSAALAALQARPQAQQQPEIPSAAASGSDRRTAPPAAIPEPAQTGV